MGHDHHFLSRLDRVASHEVELALSLYRDHALVREVLSLAKLPEGTSRVAISLAHSAEGPFIIVARDGGFVTCLGRGMRPGSLPVITRERLDAISLRVEKLREGMRIAYTLTDGHFVKLFDRIYSAGPRLAREEILALAAIKPLFASHLLVLILEAASDVHHARVYLRKASKLRHRERAVLVRAWGSLWAIGHLTVLLGMGGHEGFEEVPPNHRWLRDDFLELIFQQCVFALKLRGVWAASRLGEALLPGMKRKLEESSSLVQTVSSVAALHAISAGNPGLRAEVEDALTLPMLAEDTRYAKAVNELRRVVRKLVEVTSVDPDEAEELALVYGRAVAFGWRGYASDGSLIQYEKSQDIPDDIALRFVGWHFGDTGEEARELDAVFGLTPWIVKQHAEDFFLPAKQLVSLRLPDLPTMAHEVLQRPFQAGWMRTPTPARARQMPGRNEPCHCGSGKKYKRCCGAWSRAASGD